MRRIPPCKNILWMISLGYSNYKIEKKSGASKHTVKKIRLKWEETKDEKLLNARYSDEEIYNTLFPSKEHTSKKEKPDVDEAFIELTKGRTRKVLYEEYKKDCEIREVESISYKRFCYYLHMKNMEVRGSVYSNLKAGERAIALWLKDPIYYADEDGCKKKCYAFLGLLPYSGYAFFHIYNRDSKDNWLRGNVAMLEDFGGVPEEIYASKSKSSAFYCEIRPEYREFAYHYSLLITLNEDNKYSDEIKGRIGWFNDRMNEEIYESYEAVCQRAEEVRETYLNADAYGKGRFIDLFHAGEEKCLKKLPVLRFEPTVRKDAQIMINCHVKFENNYYSVPFRYAMKEDKTVQIEVAEHMITILSDGRVIAEHPRLKKGTGYQTHLCDMPSPEQEAQLEWNAARFISWATSIGPNTKSVIERVLKSKSIVQQTYLHCKTILLFVNEYSKEELEQACENVSHIKDGPMYKRIERLLKSYHEG